MPFLVIISRKDNEDVAVLLPPALFRFSSLLLRIENPYTQWAWIANPDQRHSTNICRVGNQSADFSFFKKSANWIESMDSVRSISKKTLRPSTILARIFCPAIDINQG
jgi:hypothetical protein